MRATSEAERHEARRRWLSTAEVAERIGGVSHRHVRALIADGLLPALNVARQASARADYRVRQDWVDEYIKRRGVNGAA